MRKRTEKMLQGLWCFPLMEDWKTETERSGEIRRKWGFSGEKTVYRGEAKHVFTHQIWQMKIYEIRIPPMCEAPKDYRFVPFGEVEALPLPTAMKTARVILLDLIGEMDTSRKTEKNEEKQR